MKKFTPIFLLIFFLAACYGRAPKAVNIINVSIQEWRYVPSQWRIPGGQEITLNIKNETLEEHEWILLKSPPTDPFDSDDEARIYFRAAVRAGETLSIHFTAPAAPGEYTVTCSGPGHLAKGLVGKVVVVQPGY